MLFVQGIWISKASLAWRDATQCSVDLIRVKAAGEILFGNRLLTNGRGRVAYLHILLFMTSRLKKSEWQQVISRSACCFWRKRQVLSCLFFLYLMFCQTQLWEILSWGKGNILVRLIHLNTKDPFVVPRCRVSGQSEPRRAKTGTGRPCGILSMS